MSRKNLGQGPWLALTRADFESQLTERARALREDPEQLLDRLAEAASRQPRFGTNGLSRASAWAADHLPDLAALAAILFLVAALALAASPETIHQRIVTVRPLPTGRILRASDLDRARSPNTSGLRSPEQAVGRVLLHPVPKGRALRKEDLGPLLPPSTVVVSISLAPDALELQPQETVSLYVISTDASLNIPRALVIAVAEGAATFALRQTDLERAAPLLSQDATVIPVRR